MTKPLTAIIVGAGHRAIAYSTYSNKQPNELKIVGVADPDPVRIKSTAEMFNIPENMCFTSAEELAKKGRIADVIINGTMDHQHVATTLPLLEVGYDVLLEKPICGTEAELKQLYDATQASTGRVVICHVLRYAPFYVEICKRLRAGEIGDILHLHTLEAVSYHHIATCFVRGKWNKSAISSMLLAKCCHDLDLVSWLKTGIAPQTVSSFGALNYFKPENAPPNAGTRCLVDCPIEQDCDYSARKHFIEQDLWSFYAWHCLEHLGTPTVEDKIHSLKTDNPHGRCVWKCDNDVVDHQTTIVQFADGSTASHDMVGATARPCRSIHLIGTKGEIQGTMEEDKFVIRHIDARKGHEYSTETIDLGNVKDETGQPVSHGGGDLRLVQDFVNFVRTGQASISTTDLSDSIHGHQIVFAADKAREKKQIITIENW